MKSSFLTAHNSQVATHSNSHFPFESDFETKTNWIRSSEKGHFHFLCTRRGLKLKKKSSRRWLSQAKTLRQESCSPEVACVIWQRSFQYRNFSSRASKVSKIAKRATPSIRIVPVTEIVR